MYFVCLAHTCQALPLTSELTNNTAKTKMGYFSVPSNLNAILGITRCYCVILKMVILHDGIKTIQNGVFLFSVNEQNIVSFSKNKKNFLFEKPGGSFFLKKTGFFNPDFEIRIFFQKQLFFQKCGRYARFRSVKMGNFLLQVTYEQTSLAISHTHRLSLSYQRIPSWDAVSKLARPSKCQTFWGWRLTRSFS